MVTFHYGVSREQYLHTLRSRYGRLSLPISSHNREVSLETVFQPLRLRSLSPYENEQEQQEAEESKNEERPSSFQEQPIFVQNGSEALEYSRVRRLIVLGGPGMGKTTLLKDLLQRAIEHALTDSAAPVPLFISLPDLARSGLTFTAYLSHLLTEMELEASFAIHLNDAIASGQAFLCLDSLDEVLPDQRPAIIAFINREALLAGGTWIISSRFTEYQGGQFSSSSFVEWELLPLDAALRRQLAAHLLPPLADLLRRPACSSDALLQALDDDWRIAEWGSNPLLFTLAAVIYTQHGLLPAHRAALYAAALDVMMELRIIDPDQRRILRDIFTHIALDLYQTRGRQFSRHDLHTLLAAHDQADDTLQEKSYSIQILNAGVLDRMGEHTYGFKHQMFQEYLAAVALAQQLTHSDDAISQGAWEFIWRKRTYSRWREVLCLLVGVLAQEHGEQGSLIAAKWLLRLAQEHTTNHGDPSNLSLILALTSLREFPSVVRYPAMLQATRTLVVLWAQTLFNALLQGYELYHYGNEWKPTRYNELERTSTRLERLLQDIRRLHLSVALTAVSTLEDAFEHAKDQQTISAKIEKRYYTLLDELALSIPSRILTLAFDEQSPIDLYTIVTARKLEVSLACEALIAIVWNQQEPWRARVGAVRLLGKAGTEAACTALANVLTDDNCSYRVRIAAAEALGWQDDAGAIQILMQAARNSDERVQIAAIQAIGHYLQNDPLGSVLSKENISPEASSDLVPEIETLVELLVSALSETDLVREAAIEASGSLHVQVPLGQLLAALHHEDARVRTGVLEALSAIQSCSSRVPLEAITELLHDSYRNVRQAAVEALGNVVDSRVPPLLLAIIENDTDDVLEYTHKLSFSAIRSLLKLSEQLPEIQRWVSAERIEGLFQKGGAHIGDLIDFAYTLRLRLAPATLLHALSLVSYVGTVHQIVQLLAMMGPDAPIAELLDMLQDSLATVQKNAARALLRLHQYVPIKPVQAHLQRSNVPMEIYVPLAEILVLHGREVDIDHLLHILKEASMLDKDILQGIVRIFHHLQTKAPIARLLVMLHEGIHPEQCAQVLRHLYELVTPEILYAESLHLSQDECMAIRVVEAMQDAAPVELLMSILQDSGRNRVVRMVALHTLHDLGVAVPLEYFVLGQDWGDYGVDDDMVESMTRLGELAPIPELVQLLGYDNEWVRNSARRAIEQLAKYVSVDLLLEALESKNILVRLEAARACAAFGERAPINKLRALVQDEREMVHVRTAALKAVAAIGSHLPVDFLLELVRGSNQHLRDAALDAFQAMGKEAPLEIILALLDEDDNDLRASALVILGSMQENAPVDLLLDLFDSADLDETSHHYAAQALATLGKYAPVDEILARLYNEDGEIREDIIDILGGLGESAPIDVLLQALSCEDAEIRERADTALYSLSESVPAYFIAQARRDTRPVVRRRVLAALIKLGKEAPIELAIASLQDEAVREHALEVLAELQVDITSILRMEALLQTLHSENEQYKSCWIELTLLAQFGAQVPLEPLLEKLGDSSADTYAATTLYKTHPDFFCEVVAPQAEAILRGRPVGGVFASHVQTRIAETIGQIARVTSDVLAMVVALLDWPYWETRLHAVRALGAIRRNIPNRAIYRLMELRHDPQSPDVRRAADAALAENLSIENSMEDE